MLLDPWRLRSHARSASFAVLASVAACAAASALAPALASESVVYSFKSGTDGALPEAGLISDQQGVLYGTTVSGGTPSCGTVFKLTPPSSGAGIKGEWTDSVLYSFCSQSDGIDGADPASSLVLGPRGALYGTTTFGGSLGYGTVFKLTPPASGQTLWTETVLYNFQGGTDGAYPSSDLIFGEDGALYGTASGGGTSNCGTYGCGTVFKLTPPAGVQTQWTETVLYSFCPQIGCSDGKGPLAGLIFDQQGALYGTTAGGGSSTNGTVFQLTPPAAGQTLWTETVLYSFCLQTNCTDGAQPYAGLIFDRQGALYGTTGLGGSDGNGTVFKLTPPASGQTLWTETVLYRFLGSAGSDGSSPYAGVIFDNDGALYGTTYGGGSSSCYDGCGTLFKLTPAAGQTQWTESVLRTFAGGSSDGATLRGGLIVGPDGALYGTTYDGGSAANGGNGYGTVFRQCSLEGGEVFGGKVKRRCLRW